MGTFRLCRMGLAGNSQGETLSYQDEDTIETDQKTDQHHRLAQFDEIAGVLGTPVQNWRQRHFALLAALHWCSQRNDMNVKYAIKWFLYWKQIFYLKYFALTTALILCFGLIPDESTFKIWSSKRPVFFKSDYLLHRSPPVKVPTLIRSMTAGLGGSVATKVPCRRQCHLALWHRWNWTNIKVGLTLLEHTFRRHCKQLQVEIAARSFWM